MDPEVIVVKENEGKNTVVPISPRSRRKPAARKPAARAKKARPTARRKVASSRRGNGAATIESVMKSITGAVAVSRAAIAEASGQGATVVRRALGSASKGSRRTVTRLANEWKAMDPKKKARILAALLGAAAAASAPLVRKTLKK